MDRGKSRNDESADDFIMIDDDHNLPFRPRSAAPEETVAVELHPLDNSDAFIVSVQTPKIPKDGGKRASCDVVLVIDVSGSMRGAAPVPEAENEDEKEAAGLSILDLTKHAARTVLETLGKDDRLAIVTFSDDAKIVQKLVQMTPQGKQTAWKRIDGLQTESCTNLWAGIRCGLEVFEQTKSMGNIQGLFVLTDGMPNHMCPQQGYVAKLEPMLSKLAEEKACTPTIHTFGFGYSLKPGLMPSIAEVGNGAYSFIPDAGMIGTVFVHSVANLYTTLGTSATLKLEVPKRLTLQPTPGIAFEPGRKGIKLNLGNLQYGQSRDLVVACSGIAADAVIHANLDYKLPNGDSQTYQSVAYFSEKTQLRPAIVDYHMSRAQICGFLSSLFPVKKNGEHGTLQDKKEVTQARSRLDAVVSAIQSLQTKHDPLVKALLEDLVGDDPAGQISKALMWSDQKNYWMKWGRHYLPSLLHAHQRQICNTFKDPGPLMYGKDSPLFIQCRAELDAAFDNLPPPKPSRPLRVVPVYDRNGTMTGTRTRAHRQVSMGSYNSNTAPCFEGDSRVTTADGSAIPIKHLTAGISVWTPMGARRVVAVVKTRVRYQDGGQLCRVGKLLVTPWHPLKHDGRWVFPQEIAADTEAFQGDVYSILLTPSRHAAAHAIEVGGQICVTMGHGITRRLHDARSHAFFGNYRRVMMSLSRLPKGKYGHLKCGGLQRNVVTGLACGFMPPQASKTG
ncbi:hypothetical protein A1O1_05506 [Capronia coronata CBS 617.96]|uniref:VWFA domain-containing protein n=1 Tax=Capronia coronata CBS 617.96 TaxID=1182541 RepID=W9YH32_9EURO|nr:uncharacterized protein A1O1_05506 [Capronia coronata CBS 617.96]EXJ88576.1 hypothetical protein A1O1_05506 [Capronia coronata CBS 617.96]